MLFKRENIPNVLISAALTLSLIAIVSALILEYGFGYIPCELCYKGRISHYVGIPVLLLALCWSVFPYKKTTSIIGLGIAVYLYSFIISIYHAGAEWKFWEGPTSCGSVNLKVGTNASDLLGMLQNTRVVSCTEPALTVLGVSLSGMNAIVCGLIIALLITAFIKSWQNRIPRGL